MATTYKYETADQARKAADAAINRAAKGAKRYVAGVLALAEVVAETKGSENRQAVIADHSVEYDIGVSAANASKLARVGRTFIIDADSSATSLADAVPTIQGWRRLYDAYRLLVKKQGYTVEEAVDAVANGWQPDNGHGGGERKPRRGISTAIKHAVMAAEDRGASEQDIIDALNALG